MNKVIVQGISKLKTTHILFFTLTVFIIEIVYFNHMRTQSTKEYELLKTLKSSKVLYQRIDTLFENHLKHQSFDVVVDTVKTFDDNLQHIEGYFIADTTSDNTELHNQFNKIKSNFELTKEYLDRYKSWKSLTINSTRLVYDMHGHLKALIQNGGFGADERKLIKLLDEITFMVALMSYDDLSNTDALKDKILALKEGVQSDPKIFATVQRLEKHIQLLSEGYQLIEALKQQNNNLHIDHDIDKIYQILLNQFKAHDRSDRINMYILNGLVILLLTTLFLVNKREEKLNRKIRLLNSELQDNIVILESRNKEFETLTTSLEEQVASRTEELKRMLGDIERLSNIDELTQLYNRRFYTNTFDNEIKRVRREKHFFNYLLLDLDCFKGYNDYYGHHLGDTALIKVAELLKALLNRPNDFAFRMGGEEFAIIFSSETEESGLDFAQKIIDSVADMKIEHIKNAPYNVLTISAGLVLCKPNKAIIGENEIYKKADELLYLAKSEGKNCLRNISLH